MLAEAPRAGEIVALAERTKQDFLFKEENIEGTVTIGAARVFIHKNTHRLHRGLPQEIPACAL